MSADVVPIPTTLTHEHAARQAHDAAVVEWLLTEAARPVLGQLVELAHLRRLAEAVRGDMDKVAEHEHTGHERIRLGAFTATRTALADLDRFELERGDR